MRKHEKTLIRVTCRVHWADYGRFIFFHIFSNFPRPANQQHRFFRGLDFVIFCACCCKVCKWHRFAIALSLLCGILQVFLFGKPFPQSYLS